jgi:molybdenum cofactor synthesis domain-containing protein
MDYRLLEKTELWVQPVKLEKVDLTTCARAAAGVLGLGDDEIMVTDVVGDVLTLDVLVQTLHPEQFIARKGELLRALDKVEGITILDETDVHSDGVLGLIGLDEKTGQEMLERTSAMVDEIAEKIRRRCIVFSTGTEVLRGQIQDTNTPFIEEALKPKGCQVDRGGPLQDDQNAIARAFRAASDDGYGLVITTGGIGAEKKDTTLGALEQVDRDARMPIIMKFQKGQRRHYREDVRIGVGKSDHTLIICLPGPHDEVQLAWPVLEKGLEENWNKEYLAEALASVLRGKFLRKNEESKRSSESKWKEG